MLDSNVSVSPFHKLGVINHTKMKCKLIKIANFRGQPNFHFEIDGKMYIYGIRGIRADYKIMLRCSKTIFRCHTSSYILPFDLLKEMIHDKPVELKSSMYSKIVDRSDPRQGSDFCASTELSIFRPTEFFLFNNNLK